MVVALNAIILVQQERITDAYNLVVGGLKKLSESPADVQILLTLIKSKIEQIHHNLRVSQQSGLRNLDDLDLQF